MASSLVIQAARFGDLVQTRRLLLNLATRGDVHLLVDRSLALLASLIYPFARVHALDFHCSQSELDDGRALLEINRIVFAELRSLGFDRIYNLNFSPATAAICRLFDPETVIGHRPGPGGCALRSAWVRLAFRLGSRRRLNPLNLVDYWGNFAWQDLLETCDQKTFSQDKRNLGLLSPFHIHPGLASSSSDLPDLACPKAMPGGQGLGVVLAGRVARRSLPVPLLAAIVQTAGKMLQARQIRLFGTAGEQGLATKLLRQLEPKVAKRVVNLCGKTDWSGLIGQLIGLDALISPDTGTMHLAAMLGVPVIGFFLSNAWCHETGPYGRGHMIFQAMPDCAPCLESAPCPSGTACLGNLQAPELLRSVARCLKGERDFAMPPGVSCLESSADSFGLRYDPIAGGDADPDLARREFVRKMICQFVSEQRSCHCNEYGNDQCDVPGAVQNLSCHVQANKASQASGADEGLSPAETGELAAWLFPENEWMLPPWRYC